MPTVVISGANRGIGLELARQYAADGWNVIAGVREPGKAEALAAISGVSIRQLHVDDPASIAAFAADLSGIKVDLLINNAGVMGPAPAAQSAAGIDVAGWLSAMQINALAPLLMAQALKPHLAPAAKVATISSIMGSIAETPGGYYAYRASKAAVNMGIRSLAQDWQADGIIFLLLHPGWVQTDMGGASAPVRPVDSAAGLRHVIAVATPADNGAFIGYDGQRIAW